MKPAAAVRTVAGTPRRSFGMGIAAMVAVAAVAMIGFLGVRVADDRRRITELAGGAYADELTRSVNAALADPSARKVELVSTDGYRNAQAVVLPDGTGYLVRSNLPLLVQGADLPALGPGRDVADFRRRPRPRGRASSPSRWAARCRPWPSPRSRPAAVETTRRTPWWWACI